MISSALPSTARRRILQILVSFGLLAASQFAAKGITIQLDYTYDSSGFFSSGSPQRTALESAASYIGDLFLDDLEAIEPDSPYFGGPGNQWEVNFQDPSNASTSLLFDDFLTVPADTLIVFAGAATYTDATLARAGFGGADLNAFPDFITTVETRGESGTTSGATATEFAPWGGFLSADDDTVWDYSIDGSTLGAGETHFYSVMIHEIAHVAGLGIAPAWSNLITGSTFTGTEASALYGSAVPTIGGDHFDNSVEGNIFGTTTTQTASLAQSIGVNETRFFTDLDVAALDDIGWDVASAPVPEPSVIALLALCAGFVFTRRQRS